MTRTFSSTGGGVKPAGPSRTWYEGVGTGGLHDNETSQYDVACYQVGQR